MDESEKIFFLKFVVRLWDDDDDDDKRRAPKPPPTICRTATPLRILLGCTRPRRKECPVDDDDRTTTRTTARCEYKFSVARLFFSMRRNFRSRLVFLSAMALRFITKTVNRGYDLPPKQIGVTDKFGKKNPFDG